MTQFIQILNNFFLVLTEICCKNLGFKKIYLFVELDFNIKLQKFGTDCDGLV